MDESERLQRYRENHSDKWAYKNDEKFSDRIAKLLNHKHIDKYCMVDAYYYDFSVIPREIQEKLDIWRDAYFIFGITTKGEIISKWVDRWDLDSDDEIIDGKVIKSDKPQQPIPTINQNFDPMLLSVPTCNLTAIFDIGKK